VWLEGLGQLKNPAISSGIEPATFWLVEYCLNQLFYCEPHRLSNRRRRQHHHHHHHHHHLISKAALP
jgi:hypothetical protein